MSVKAQKVQEYFVYFKLFATQAGAKFAAKRARGFIQRFLKRLARRNPQFRFQYYSRNPQADMLLVLHACPSACAEIPQFPGKVISLAVPRADSEMEEQEQRFLQTVESALTKGNPV